MDYSEAKATIADIIMTKFIGTLCIAAGKEAEVSAKYSWRLLGDFDGTWLMDLTPGAVGVRKYADEKIDGEIYWVLSMEQVKDFLQGKYRFAQAYERSEFLIKADRPNLLKFAKVIGAFSQVDLEKAFKDPQQYLREKFEEDH